MDNKHYDAQYLNNTFEVMKGIKLKSHELLSGIRGNIVDIGCGTGLDVFLMSTSIADATIIGLDHDPALIDYAKKNYQSPRIQFMQGSILYLPFPDSSIQAIRAERVFQHVIEDKKGLQEIYRTLVPNGTFVILETDWNSIVFDSFPLSISNKITYYFANIKVVNGRICKKITALLKQTGFTIKDYIIQQLSTQTYEEAQQFLLLDQLIPELLAYPDLFTADEKELIKTTMQCCETNNSFFATLNFYTITVLK